MEISQHARYTCTFCGKNTVKRHSVGIWSCKACKKTVAGGAWTVSYVLLGDKMENLKGMTAYMVNIQNASCRGNEINHSSTEGDRGGMMAI